MKLRLLLAAACAALCPRAAEADVYQYDQLGRLRAVIFQNGQAYTYTYDGAGNRLSAQAGGATSNLPPVALDDTAPTITEGSTLAYDPRGNDHDPEGQSLTITATANGAYGSASHGAGQVFYTPTNRQVQSHSFGYTVADPSGQTDTATVSVTVQNLPPVAVNDAVTALRDQSNTFTPLANDTDPGGDPLVITGASGAANGAVSFNGSSITYTPNSGFNGPDAVTYAISDGEGGTSSATISIQVTGPNRPPVAADNTRLVYLLQSNTFNVVGNDTDPDGDTLRLTAVTQGAKGSVSIAGLQTVTYTPNHGAANGDSDTFTYTVTDDRGGFDSATVTVFFELP